MRRFRRSPTAQHVTVSVNRAASNGTSLWVPSYTVVQNEWAYPWGTNNGPETTAGTGQYVARQNEKLILKRQNYQIQEWGRSSIWKLSTDPTPNPSAAYNSDSAATGYWGGGDGLDGEISKATTAGLEVMMTLYGAPYWMLGQRTAGNGVTLATGDGSGNYYQSRVLTNQLSNWLALVNAIVRRYVVAPYNVRTFQVWNEFKGFHNPDTNNWDADTSPGTAGKADMGYTYLYNQTRAQILSSAAAVGVSSGIRVGGPYVPDVNWTASTAGGFPVTNGNGSSNDVLSGSKPYGYMDKRALDATKTWLQEKTGAEFIAIRADNKTSEGNIPTDDWGSMQLFSDIATWVRGLPEATYPGATTLPFFDAELYTWPSTDAAVSAKINALSAESYRLLVRAGYESALRWGSTSIDGLSLWTTDASTDIPAGYGLPGNGFTTEQAFHDHFPAGTALYPETISDPTKASALANGSGTLLINKTSGYLAVLVEGAYVTLAPYDVRFVST